MPFYKILFLLVLFSGLQAQDPVYSQYYNASSQLNSAFTGITDAPLISINYRNQWPLINNAYTTYSVSYDQYFRDYNSGFGLVLLGDSAGDGAFLTNKINLLYSYQLTINDDFLIKLGAEAGFFQTRLNWDKLVFGDNLDRFYGAMSPGGITYPTDEVKPTNTSTNNLDVSTGMMLYSSKFFAGFSLKHVNNPTIDFLNSTNDNQSLGLPMRFSFHTGATFLLREKYRNSEPVFLSPHFLLSKQGDFLQINTGVYAQINQFVASLSVRYAYHNLDALIFGAGWKYNIYKFMYSFDFTLSSLGLSSGGAHELGIIINFDKIYPNKSRSIECFELLR